MSTESSNPYVGLRPFGLEDSPRFFGRAEQTEELLDSLKQTRFLAVVGSSGCGKSSLVHAGLLPELTGGFLVEERDQWRFAVMRPGDAPIRNLTAALLTATSDGNTSPAEMETLRKAIKETQTNALIDYLDTALADDANLLLLVDQFEEIFSFRGLEAEEPPVEPGADQYRERARRRATSAAFVDLLIHLGVRADLPVYTVLTMRTDFLGDCDLFYGLPEALNRGRYLVPRLTREQLRQAIQGPARLDGAQFAPRLLDLLLNELGDRTDRLPVLQHALYRTWEAWAAAGDGGPIDLEHYRTAGTLENALSIHAEEAVEESDLEATGRIFKCITDTDATQSRVRRPAALCELQAVTGLRRTAVEAILGRFQTNGRSFVFLSKETEQGDRRVDLSHESLIRQWERLRRWVDEERESRDRFIELVRGARLEAKAEKPLLRDPELQLALDWREASHPTAAWAERYSRRTDDFNVAMEYLDRSKETFGAAAVRRRKRTRVAGVVSAAIIVAALAGLTIWAIDGQKRAKEQALIAEQREKDALEAEEKLREEHAKAVKEADNAEKAREEAERQREETERQRDEKERQRRLAVEGWQEAEDQARRAAARRLAAISLSQPDNSLDLALLLATEAHRTADLAESRNSLLTGLQANPWLLTYLTGHAGAVSSVAFAPDGKTLASGGSDGTVRLWNVGTHQPLGEPFSGNGAGVSSVAFAPDGKTLASGGSDGAVRLWNVGTRQRLGEPLTGHGYGNRVSSVAFAPDGRTLASGGSDGAVRFWNVATRQPIGEPLTGSADQAVGGSHFLYASETSVAFAADGRTLAAGGSDGTVRLWNVATRQPLGDSLAGRGAGVSSVAFAPDGKTLVSGGSDGTVHLWNVDSLQLLGEPFSGHSGGVSSVAFARDGKTLASGSSDGTVRLWKVDTRQPLGEPFSGHSGGVSSVGFARDGKTLASGGSDGTVRLWKVDTRQPLGEPLTGHSGGVSSVAFARDGKTLASGGSDGTVRLWKVDTRQPLGEPLTGHSSRVSSVAFARDGKTLASGGSDGTVRLWNVDTLQPLGEPLVGYGGGVSSVAFAPDGKTLALGGSDGMVRLWNVDTHQPIGEPLSGHGAGASSVAFAPDGKTVASGGSDGTVRLWSMDTLQPLGDPITAHGYWVRSLAFAPDSKTLASGGDDRTVRLWDVDPASWRRRACRVANRNLSLREWKQLIGRDVPYRCTCPNLPLGHGTDLEECTADSLDGRTVAALSKTTRPRTCIPLMRRSTVRWPLNIFLCGTYPQSRAAIHKAAGGTS